MEMGLRRTTISSGHSVVCLVALAVCLGTGRGLADTQQNSSQKTVKDVIYDLLNSEKYDPTISPAYDTGESVRVEVDVVLNTLGPVKELEMQMTASFYLRQQWRDPRLAYSAALNPNNQSTFLLSYKRAQELWLPDLYFSQSKDERKHEVTVPNLMIRLHPDGTLLFSQRLTVTFQCLMNLRRFPLDDQVCYIRMESFSHMTSDMYFAWSSQRKSMDKMENAHIPDFELTKITTHDCTAIYATGTFPCLEARLYLARQIGFYMIQTYIPCILIVSLSWLSFWLDAHAIPARISVGLLTVLTITTQSFSVRSELPRVPYTKSIDVWMSVCLVFVFAAYMQYAFVTVFSRRYHKTLRQIPSSATKKTDKSNTKNVETEFQKIERSTNFDDSNDGLSNGKAHDVRSTNGHAPNSRLTNGQAPFDNNVEAESAATSQWYSHNNSIRLEKEARDNGHLVDKWSRIMFPVFFGLFNFGYWIYYTQ